MPATQFAITVHWMHATAIRMPRGIRTFDKISRLWESKLELQDTDAINVAA
jgi:hypothetical protein